MPQFRSAVGRTSRAFGWVVQLAALAALWSGPAWADATEFSPGAPGLGDPYFPLDGNGGYDVQHYGLELRIDPAGSTLSGRATITARASQNLSRFNLDLLGLNVSAVTVNGCDASWSHEASELSITPRRGLRSGREFEVIIEYSGVLTTQFDPLGSVGFIPTATGGVILGEPHAAASWFPVNDHPTDRASYTFEIGVPDGFEAVANGALIGQSSEAGWTTWTWDAEVPMASYLALLAFGQLELQAYEWDGIRYWDAADAELFLAPVQPRTGSGYAISQPGVAAYKRLARVISVPAGGATLSFWAAYDTEPDWDFLFVEAHHPGQDDWTTLPDAEGHALPVTAPGCDYLASLHRFVFHYQSPPVVEGGPCGPTGSSGEWWAATGTSDGLEPWTVDLSAWAGSDVEVSISYASDGRLGGRGVWVDDVVVSTGEGSTSFEADDDPLDGWVVAGAPEGSAANPDDWISGGSADSPTLGDSVFELLGREPEFLAFLSDQFGPYPFDVAGGVGTTAEVGFALETQTRPVYPALWLANGEETLPVHELAHQWFGDSVGVAAWQHIWLNEGFATYAEWLWNEAHGIASAQEVFDAINAVLPEDDPFWTLPIGDPGPELMFDAAVYYRGAMTLHALRSAVGDADFFEILQTWTAAFAGENVTTDDFIALAECMSGRELDALFEAWLFTPVKPGIEGAPGEIASAP